MSDSLKNAKTLPDALVATAVTYAVGKNGGEKFSPPSSLIKNGPIDRIKLRVGGMLDQIEVFYAGKSDGGHGGNGGSALEMNVPVGHYIENVVGSEHRDVVGFLDFITKDLPGTPNPKIMHHPFGDPHGIFYKLGTDGSRPLRSISGRSGGYVDKLEFNYGHYYRIENVAVDVAALEAQLKETAEKINVDFGATSNTHNNPTNDPERFDFSFDYAPEHPDFEIGATDDYRMFMRGQPFSATIQGHLNWGVSGDPYPMEFQARTDLVLDNDHAVVSQQSRRVSKTFSVPGGKLLVVQPWTVAADLTAVPLSFDVIFFDFEDGVRKDLKTTPAQCTISGRLFSQSVYFDTELYPAR